MLQASVVICSHDPRPHYLRRVLEALRAQTLPLDRWELLLIDNASRQPLSTEWDVSWHPNARHVLEPELGLAWARRRGIGEASAEPVVFVDDDNVLGPNYLSEVARIAHEWPQLGTWGSGATVPEFEVPPSPYVTKVLPYLALREVHDARWCNFPAGQATPWGAGLCLRKSVADAYSRQSLDSGIVISGRKGSALLSGDDVELSYIACSLGLGIGVFPELRLTHLIPAERVEKDYLLRVVEGTFISNVLLSYKWDGIKPRSPWSMRGLSSVVKHLLTLSGIERDKYIASIRATRRARRMIGLVEAAESLGR
jgi:glycosyltransferase involved in cell wall biosynthesis